MADPRRPVGDRLEPVVVEPIVEPAAAIVVVPMVESATVPAIPSERIRSIDIGPALAMAGVHAVLTADEAHALVTRAVALWKRRGAMVGLGFAMMESPTDYFRRARHGHGHRDHHDHQPGAHRGRSVGERGQALSGGERRR